MYFGGGTVVIPTDTVYGLGCDPMRLDAVARVKRTAGDHRPLVLHVGSVIEALEYATANVRNFAAVRRLLPGAVTLIVKRPHFVDERLTAGLPTLGLRVPDHWAGAAVLERCGPFAVAAAGRGGREPFPDCDLVVDAGPARSFALSTVLDLTGERPRLIREGVVTMEMLERTIGRVDR